MDPLVTGGQVPEFLLALSGRLLTLKSEVPGFSGLGQPRPSHFALPKHKGTVCSSLGPFSLSCVQVQDLEVASSDLS